MDRREFFEKAGLWSLAGIVAGNALITQGCKAPAAVLTNSSVSDNKIRVLKADWPTDKDFIVVKHPTDEHPVFVYKEGQHYLALHLKCTHRGCTVEAKDNILACPCHGSRFDMNGNVTRGPAKKPLVSYPVTADGEYVYVQYM